LNSLEEKITAHFGTIYLISFTKFSLRSPAMRVKFSQTYKKITASFGVDYFLPLPLVVRVFSFGEGFFPFFECLPRKG